MEYRARVADIELAQRIESAGAVVVQGPKACGKTETARRQAASVVFLDIDTQARAAAELDPGLVLEGSAPRLIDEWQFVPTVWNAVRRAVDDRGAAGQFILTGSATPTDAIDLHTGAGRFSFVRMRPFSLYEAGHSTGAVSLAGLMAGEKPSAPSNDLTVAQLAELIVRGGWPAQHDRPLSAAMRAATDYLLQISTVDIQTATGVRHDPLKVQSLLRSLARNIATEAAITTLAADTAGDGSAIDRDTVSGYLAGLSRLMIVEDAPAWAPHLRSKRELRSSPKRHFVDPSLAAAALRAGPDKLLADLNFFGLLFESLVVRDLRILSQPLDGTVLHYRDGKNLEVDAIVDLPDGRWGAFEVKLGGEARIEEGARSLRDFLHVVDTSRRGQPAVVGIIVATGYAYTRQDGIAVIPIGVLAP